LNKLVDAGNTVVIEHNLEVIKSADYTGFGPEGGEKADRSLLLVHQRNNSNGVLYR
jgi:excinuclease UvrABC ATPase subunit